MKSTTTVRRPKPTTKPTAKRTLMYTGTKTTAEIQRAVVIHSQGR